MGGINTLTAPHLQQNGAVANAKTKAKEVSQKFESFFLYQALEIMQPEPSEDSMFTGGAGEEAFRHTMNEHLADNIAKSGGVGIADHVYGELLRFQDISE